MFVRFLDCFSHAVCGKIGLGVDVDVGALHSGGVRRDDRSFQQTVGHTFHQVAVLEDTRLALFRVHDEISGLDLYRARPLPLQRRRKVRASSASEAGLLDLLDQLIRRHRQCFCQARIASVIEVGIDDLAV